MELIEGIELFRAYNEPKKEIQILRENGQVLLQLFNYHSTFKIYDIGDNLGYILLIHFFRTKTNNKANYQRFIDSEYYKSFVQPKPDSKDEQDMFCTLLPKHISNHEMLTYVAGLLRDVYGKETRIVVRVNIW
ncbi:hypothetical protein GCM10009118_34390 [Wandonia haliotis]|uniref:Uncharacterized protein n=1 Tax=Wandonia haliotis TaxID=574963 RepID=A0ABN1MVQ9_9FLAO